jgi:hypothetical protein
VVFPPSVTKDIKIKHYVKITNFLICSFALFGLAYWQWQIQDFAKGMWKKFPSLLFHPFLFSPSSSLLSSFCISFLSFLLSLYYPILSLHLLSPIASFSTFPLPLPSRPSPISRESAGITPGNTYETI